MYLKPMMNYFDFTYDLSYFTLHKINSFTIGSLRRGYKYLYIY